MYFGWVWNELNLLCQDTKANGLLNKGSILGHEVLTDQDTYNDVLNEGSIECLLIYKHLVAGQDISGMGVVIHHGTLSTLSSLIDLAEKKAIDGDITIRIAQETIQTLQFDLAKKDC